MRSQRIFIGKKDSDLLYNFNNAIEKLNGIITRQQIEEYGEDMTTETLHTLLMGGEAIRLRMVEKFNTSLGGVIFPAERRQKESVYTDLLSSYTVLCDKARAIVRDFAYIPVECYVIDGNGQISYDKIPVNKIFDEQTNIYIDRPEQIEAYEAAVKASEALKALDAIAGKYGFNALSERKSILDLSNYDVYPLCIAECHPDGLMMRKHPLLGN